MSTALERAGHLAHLRGRAYQAHYARAVATVERALELCQRPYVGFSGGKDSEALLWVVAEVWPDAQVRILTGGETRILHPELDDVLAWWQTRFPAMTITEVHIDHVFAEGWQEAGFWEQYATFKGEWHRYLMPAGTDGVVLGLRSDESPTRARALRLRADGESLAIYRYLAGPMENVYRICPLDRWTTADVGALLVAENIPLLGSYVAGGMDARTHTRLGKHSLQCGQLLELRQRDPAGFNRLLARFPELAEYVEMKNR